MIELALGPFRRLDRSLVGWAIGLGALIVITVAFWPVFRGSSGVSEAIERLPPGVIDALGLAGFGTPAGFLRGNLYDVFVPLLMAIGAVATASGLTAGDEESGRLETYLTQPVTRQAVLAGRIVATGIWVAVLTGALIAVQLVSDALMGLDIDAGRVIATVILCGLLAFLAAMLAIAVAGWLARPAVVVGVAIAATLGAYIVSALFPLSDLLEPLHELSPWDWALGGDPLVGGAEAWRFAAPVALAALLAFVAIAGFVRRDIRAA
jgi:ABC-2 type transport system permease protein